MNNLLIIIAVHSPGNTLVFIFLNKQCKVRPSPDLGIISSIMNQVPDKYSILTTGSNHGKPDAGKSESGTGISGNLPKNINSQLFLSDEELENIKERIRKRHHSNTTRLLILYGLLLIVFISCLSYLDILN